jgi:serine/threonine protein kinase
MVIEKDALNNEMQKIKDKRKNKSLALEDFHVGKRLGEGRFGTVYMVTHKATRTIYAMKKICKEQIKSNKLINQFIL